MAYTICTFALVWGVASHFMLQQLDQATAKQCAAHDWPKPAHDIHMDWCKANGYKTN
jgi:hypothetical protein